MRRVNRYRFRALRGLKTGTCLTLFWACILLIPACSMKHTGNPAGGFRGIPWGSPPASVKGFEIIEDHKTMVIATRQDEKLRMGSADLDEIRYYFMNDSLFQVEVLAKGRENLWHIKQEIEKQHGPPTSVKDQISHYFWRKGNLAIHLNYYTMPNRVIAKYSHVPAAKQERVKN